MTVIGKAILVAAAATVALAIGSACGSGDEATGSPKSPTVGAARRTEQATIDPNSKVIDQVNMAFTPGRLTVKAGETVVFKNSDAVIHSVTINGKSLADSMKKGDSVSNQFDKPGEYKIACVYHPAMKATVVVE